MDNLNVFKLVYVNVVFRLKHEQINCCFGISLYLFRIHYILICCHLWLNKQFTSHNIRKHFQLKLPQYFIRWKCYMPSIQYFKDFCLLLSILLTIYWQINFKEYNFYFVTLIICNMLSVRNADNLY